MKIFHEITISWKICQLGSKFPKISHKKTWNLLLLHSLVLPTAVHSQIIVDASVYLIYYYAN